MKKNVSFVKDYAIAQIARHEAKITELTEKVNSSFLYQFSWKIKDLYKAHYLEREWTGILEAYNNYPEKEEEMLTHHETYFLKKALSTVKLNTSTNDATNLAMKWEHECDIELASFFR